MNINWGKINPLEGMVIAIHEDGQKNVWKWIEGMGDPLQRVRYRFIYFEAMKLIENGKKK